MIVFYQLLSVFALVDGVYTPVDCCLRRHDDSLASIVLRRIRVRGDPVAFVLANTHAPETGGHVPPSFVQDFPFIFNFEAVAMEVDLASRVDEFRGCYQIVWDVRDPKGAPSGER